MRPAARNYFDVARNMHGEDEAGSAFFLAYIDLLAKHPDNSKKVEKGLLNYVDKNKKSGYFLTKLYDWNAFHHLSEIDSSKKAADIGKKTLLHLGENPDQHDGFTTFRRSKLAGSIGINLFKQGAKKHSEAMIYLLFAIPSGLASAYKAMIDIRTHRFVKQLKPKSKFSKLFTKSNRTAVPKKSQLPRWTELEEHLAACRITANLGLYTKMTCLQDDLGHLEDALAAYNTILSNTENEEVLTPSRKVDEYLSALRVFLDGKCGQLLCFQKGKDDSITTLEDDLSTQCQGLDAILPFGDKAVWGTPADCPQDRKLALHALQQAHETVQQHLGELQASAFAYLDELYAGKGKNNKLKGRLKPVDLELFCNLHVEACKNAVAALAGEYDEYQLGHMPTQAINNQIDNAWENATEDEDNPRLTTMSVQPSQGINRKHAVVARLRASDGGKNAVKQELKTLTDRWINADANTTSRSGWTIPKLEFTKNSEVSTKTTLINYVHSVIMRQNPTADAKLLKQRLVNQYSYSFYEVLEEEEATWNYVNRRFEIHLNGNAHDFTSDSDPAQRFLDKNLPIEKRIARNESARKGVGSHNRKQVQHINNFWKTELNGGAENSKLFSAFRHGVLCAFNLNSQKILATCEEELSNTVITAEVANNYSGIVRDRSGCSGYLSKESLTAKLTKYRDNPDLKKNQEYKSFMDGIVTAARMTSNKNMQNELLVAAWGNLTEEARQAEDAVPLNILSINLLTPEAVTKPQTLLTGPGLKPSSLEMVNAQEHLLDDIRQKSRQNGLKYEIQTQNGKVDVNPNIISCCYGVNELALGRAGPVTLGNADHINEPLSTSITDLAGILQLGQDSDAWKNRADGKNKDLAATALRKITELRNSTGDDDHKKADLIIGLIQQINYIQKHKLYAHLGNDGYKMVTRLAYLGYLLDFTVFFNCKSGKDRTAFMDGEVKAFAGLVAITGKLPKVNEKLSAEVKTLVGEFHLNSGGAEVQQSCVGLPGGKVRWEIAQRRMNRAQHDIFAGGCQHVKS